MVERKKQQEQQQQQHIYTKTADSDTRNTQIIGHDDDWVLRLGFCSRMYKDSQIFCSFWTKLFQANQRNCHGEQGSTTSSHYLYACAGVYVPGRPMSTTLSLPTIHR